MKSEPVEHKEVDGTVSLTISVLHSCLDKAFQEWHVVEFNCCGRHRYCLPRRQQKKHSILKRPSLDPTVLDNFCQVSNLAFLGKVVERVAVCMVTCALVIS